MARTVNVLRNVPPAVLIQMGEKFRPLIHWLSDIIVNMSGTAGNIPMYEATGVGFEDSGISTSGVVASATFTNGDGDTVTVTNGLITDIS